MVRIQRDNVGAATIAEAAFVENGGGTAVNDDSTFGGYTLQQIAQALIEFGVLK